MKDRLLSNLKAAEQVGGNQDQYLQLVCEELLSVFRQAEGTPKILASDLKAILLAEPLTSISQLVRIINGQDNDTLRRKVGSRGIDGDLIKNIDRTFELAGKRKVSGMSAAQIMGAAVTELTNLLQAKKEKTINQEDLDQIASAIFKVLKTVSEKTGIKSAQGFKPKTPDQIKAVLVAGYEFEKLGEFIEKVVDPASGNTLKEISNAVNRSGFKIELLGEIREIFKPFGSQMVVLKPTQVIEKSAEDLQKAIAEAKKIGKTFQRNMADYNSALNEIANNFSIFITQLCANSTMEGLELIKFKSAENIAETFLTKEIEGPNDLFRALTGNDQISTQDLRYISSSVRHFGVDRDLVIGIGDLFKSSDRYRAVPKPQNEIKLAAENFKQVFIANEHDDGGEAQIKIVDALTELLNAFSEHSMVKGVQGMKFLSSEEIRVGFLTTPINSFTDFVKIITGEDISNARDSRAEVLRSAFRSQAVEIDLNFIRKVEEFFKPLRLTKLVEMTTSSSESEEKHKDGQVSTGSLDDVEMKYLDTLKEEDAFELFKDEIADSEKHRERQPSTVKDEIADSEKHGERQPSTVPAAKRDSATKMGQSDSKMVKLSM